MRRIAGEKVWSQARKVNWGAVWGLRDFIDEELVLGSNFHGDSRAKCVWGSRRRGVSPWGATRSSGASGCVRVLVQLCVHICTYVQRRTCIYSRSFAHVDKKIGERETERVCACLCVCVGGAPRNTYRCKTLTKKCAWTKALFLRVYLYTRAYLRVRSWGRPLCADKHDCVSLYVRACDHAQLTTPAQDKSAL